MAAKKSYWQSMVSDSDGAREAIRAWFAPLGDEMTPYKAEVLCDIETDAEKKLRAFMTDKDGANYELTRSAGVRGRYTIAMKRLAA